MARAPLTLFCSALGLMVAAGALAPVADPADSKG